MKNVILIIAISFTILSCQKDTIDKPINSIQTNIPPPDPIPPKISITYKILDSGYVQFISNSQNIVSQRWRVDYFNSRYSNPLFRFTKNGLYTCYYTASNVLGANIVFKDTSFTIEIKNAVRLDKDRIISGVVFDDSVSFVSDYNDKIQNGLRSMWPFGFAPYPPCVEVWTNSIPMKVVIADYNQEPGKDLASMRNVLTKGIKKLSKTICGNGPCQLTNGWAIWLGYKDYVLTNHPKNAYYTPDSKSSDELLEIMDVKEVHQPYLFPNLESTAFLVTFHFKTTTDDGRKIDLTIPVKYMAYNADDWY